MNYVKLIFGQEFQSCIKLIDSAMFVCSKYQEINKKIKLSYLKHIFVTVAFLH